MNAFNELKYTIINELPYDIPSQLLHAYMEITRYYLMQLHNNETKETVDRRTANYLTSLATTIPNYIFNENDALFNIDISPDHFPYIDMISTVYDNETTQSGKDHVALYYFYIANYGHLKYRGWRFYEHMIFDAEDNETLASDELELFTDKYFYCDGTAPYNNRYQELLNNYTMAKVLSMKTREWLDKHYNSNPLTHAYRHIRTFIDRWF